MKPLRLAIDEPRDRVLLVTWVNHYSIQQCLKFGVTLEEFDFIGIDGLFLLKLLGLAEKNRSSADIFLPMLVASSDYSIGLIGGTSKQAKEHAFEMERRYPGSTVVWSLGGFGEEKLLLIEEPTLEIPDLIFVGMGPGRQEQTAIALRQVLAKQNKYPIIFTCGGWLDQILFEEYYPRWAYPLRLNWLVRLVREPKRLSARYTLWAFRAVVARKKIKSTLIATGKLAN